jgi:hypothetical protein
MLRNRLEDKWKEPLREFNRPVHLPHRTAISLPLAASQMRAVWSHDAVTMRDPSGLKAAEFTWPSWPRRIAISLALAASQMRALSAAAVTMRDPSGLKAADRPLAHRTVYRGR